MQDAKSNLPGRVATGDGAARPMPWEMPRFRNWIAVGKVNMLVERALNRGLAPLGLKCAQFDVLAAIFRFPGLTQQELADKLLVGRSNMSMLLPDLMRRGLIERRSDARDARVRRLHLTAEGDALSRQAFAVQTGVIEGMMGALSAEECDQLGDMMRRIGRHMVDKDIGA
jgi:MarR family transcriptional regulator, organic hydroperoxide resistance regulator